MSAGNSIVIPQSMLDALDRAIDARLDARDKANRQAAADAPLWLSQAIWFWQVGKYQDAGWSTGWTIVESGLFAVIDDLCGRIRPTAHKAVDRHTGNPFDFEAHQLAYPPLGFRVVQEVGRRPRLVPDRDARSDTLDQRIREASSCCRAAAAEVARAEAGIRSVVADHGE